MEDNIPQDKDSTRRGEFPAFHGYGASGNANGQIVYVNYGSPADHARLKEMGISVEGRIVLVRQYRHGYGGITLGLPAGALEPSDMDPAAGGVRELLEETGYASDDVRVVGTISPNAATHSNRLHVILAVNAYFLSRQLTIQQKLLR